MLAGAALEDAGIRYFLGGSLASSMQGDPRSTNDIDFVVDMTARQVAHLATALGAEFSVDEIGLRTASAIGQSTNVFYLPLFMKVDLIPRGHTPFDDAEFERRKAITVRGDGATLWVKSPEDSVLRKLWWYVQGRSVSERQWRDVVAILRVGGGTLEDEYLAQWATQLGVEELLGRARAEASLPTTVPTV